jgi:catechol 2,3-dioxygenase-like lactoylglutathione lyase family enzyme
MTHDPGVIVVSLPVADRSRSSTFYRAFLGQVPPGEPVDDGGPEPLQFLVNDGLRLMLVPRGGFRLGGRRPGRPSLAGHRAERLTRRQTVSRRYSPPTVNSTMTASSGS